MKARLEGLSLKGKLGALVGIALLGVALFGLVAKSTVDAVGVRGHSYREIVRAKDIVADVLPPPEYIVEPYLVVFRLATSTDVTERKALLADLKTLRAAYDDRHNYWTEDLEPSALRDALVDGAHAPAQTFWDLVDSRFVPAISRGDHAQAMTLALGPLADAYRAQRTAVDRVVDLATQRQVKVERNAGRLLSQRTVMLVGVLVLIVLALLGAARLIIGSLSGRLHALTAAARDLADGDLTHAIAASGADEIGQLGRSFNTTLEALATTVSGIASRSQLLAGASDELATISEQLAMGASEARERSLAATASGSEVSYSVNAVSTAIRELTIAIDEIARNAAAAANTAQAGVNLVSEANALVDRLRSSSHEVSEVVALITTVAERTNLLALNAAIEASRAGEAGRGFSVVANEVKQLAQQTARATEDVSNRVFAIQDEAIQAATAIESIAGVVGEIDGYQRTIAAAVEQQAAMTKEISTNVAAVDRGGAQIVENMTLMALASQETAGGIDATHSSAKDLRRMASELDELVGAFRY